MKRAIYIFPLLVLLALTAVSFSQSLREEEEKRLREELKLALTDRSLAVADEYLDVLDQLMDLLVEYQDYLVELDTDDDHLSQISHSEVLDNLENQEYNNDPQRLLEDVRDLVNEIKRVEARHKAEQNTNSPRCCRVSRNFRKDLNIISELIEDHTDKRVVTVLNEENIQKYIEQVLKALEGGLKELEGLEGLEGLNEIPDVPGVTIITPEGVPSVPSVLRPRGIRSSRDEAAEEVWQRWLTESDRKSRGQLRQHVKNVAIRSSRPTIDITSPGGDVWIEGHDSDELLVRFGFVVQARSKSTEAKFIELSGLEIIESGNRYIVEASLPKLTDTRTEVLRSVMVISVPWRNLVDCQSSFGAVSLLHLKGGATVRCENSRVMVMDVTGDTRVSNSMGPILLEEIRGDIMAQNSYGEINLVECKADQIEIENVYASVSLSDIQAGETGIENSGMVTVTDLAGELFIQNAYGLVELSGIRGDIDVSNSYQPIVISEVAGSAHLQNTYANIEISDISGTVTVSNERGSIKAFEVIGPVDLSSSFGNVYLMVGNELASGSSIYTTDGTINLTANRGTDLLIKAHTIDGMISSSEPLIIIPSGDSKTAELVLGEGSAEIDLSGNNAAIVINVR